MSTTAPVQHDSLARLQGAAADFYALRDASGSALLHRVGLAIHRICAEALAAEQQGVGPDEVRAALAPAREAHAASPFVRRLQEWPRGYPGDWETVEYLCDGPALCATDGLAGAIEWFTLNTAVAQQHRNKIQWQADQCARTARATKAPRILSVGCGGARDIWQVARTGLLGTATVVLNDLDERALAMATERLAPLVRRVAVHSGNALRVVGRFARGQPFDLILVGGLLDYMDERRSQHILWHLTSALNAKGRLCFTNIATGNPYRPWMEYIANWRLVERSEGEASRLAALGDGAADIARDSTGLTWLVETGR